MQRKSRVAQSETFRIKRKSRPFANVGVHDLGEREHVSVDTRPKLPPIIALIIAAIQSLAFPPTFSSLVLFSDRSQMSIDRRVSRADKSFGGLRLAMRICPTRRNRDHPQPRIGDAPRRDVPPAQHGAYELCRARVLCDQRGAARIGDHKSIVESGFYPIIDLDAAPIAESRADRLHFRTQAKELLVAECPIGRAKTMRAHVLGGIVKGGRFDQGRAVLRCPFRENNDSRIDHRPGEDVLQVFQIEHRVKLATLGEDGAQSSTIARA